MTTPGTTEVVEIQDNTVVTPAPDVAVVDVGYSQPAGTAPTGAAGGDLSGPYPAPDVRSTHLAAPLPAGQGGTGVGVQQVFYLDSYSGATDDDKMTAALADLIAAAGGEICLSPRHHVFTGQWATAYTATAIAVRIRGAGVAFNGAWGTPDAATTCDMQYAGSGAARMDFQHTGTIEIAGIAFTDTVGSTVPFFQTTNATPDLHDNVWAGSKTGAACDQDAIVLGGTGTVIGAGDTAPYQGYQGSIRRQFFSGIRRGVRAQTYANAVRIESCVWSATCGSPNVFQVADAVMTAGSGVLTSASGPFTPAMTGQLVLVAGAGSPEQGGILAGHITGYTSPTQVTLSVLAEATVSGAAAVAPEAPAIELDAGPAQLSGLMITGCLIEATHYAAAIALRGATTCLIDGTSFWDAVAGQSWVGVYCDDQAQGNTVLGPFSGLGAVGGATLAEEITGTNTIVDGTVAAPRVQLAQSMTFTGLDGTIGLRFGGRGLAADITVQRVAAALVMAFSDPNGYLRVTPAGKGTGVIAARVPGAAYDSVQLGTDGTGAGILSLGLGTAAPDTVLQRLGAALYGPGGATAWMAYGGERWRAASETAAAYTVAAAVRIVLADATAQPMTVTLQYGTDGEVHTIVKTDAGANQVTVQSSGGKTISGAASFTLDSQYDKATFLYSAAAGEWLVVGGHQAPLAVAQGGTGAATAAGALASLGALADPLTTAGDMVVAGAGGTPGRLAAGSHGERLMAGPSGSPQWLKNGRFNVYAYGAVGDGVTDDTAAILAAMADAGPVGATVEMPGTFAISAPLKWQPSAGGLTNQAFYAPSLHGAGDGATSPRFGSYEQGGTLLIALPSFPPGEFMIDYLGDTGTDNCIAGYEISGISLSCGGIAAGVRNFNAHTSYIHDITINDPAAPNPAYEPGGHGGFSAYASPTYNAYNNRYARITVYAGAEDNFFVDEGKGSAVFLRDCTSLNATRYGYQMGDGTFAVNCGSQSSGTAEFNVWHAQLVGCFVDGPTGTTNGNAVQLTGNSNRTARFTGCTFYGSQKAGTEEATAVVQCGYTTANAVFTGCTFISGSQTSDWVYVQSNALGSMAFHGCLFTTVGGSPLTGTPYNTNGAALTLTFDSCTGIPSNEPVGGDLSGTLDAPEVVSTHLAAPLPIGQGGTGASTAAAALAALGVRPLPLVTVSPTGLADGAAIANNGADYGPDTTGTVTSGIKEAVDHAVAQALAGTTVDVVLLGGKFKLSQFTDTTYRIAVPIDAGYAASAGPPISVTIRGTGYAMNAPEGTAFKDAFSLGPTVIDASGLDVLAEGLYKQGRVFGVVPRLTSGPGLSGSPTNAVQLVVENMAVVLPTYNAAGTGSPAYPVGSLFVDGDTQSSNTTHWQFVNGIDAWAASSFKCRNVNVTSALAAYNATGNRYGGGGGVLPYGSAAGIVFPQASNQGNDRFETISAYDLHIGVKIGTHTSGDQFYAQACTHTIYHRSPGHGARLGRINVQAPNIIIQHKLLNQLTTSTSGAYFDPVGDLYAPIGLSFPSAASPSSLSIGEASLEATWNHFLVDDPANPLTVVANVDYTGTVSPAVWGSGANLTLNFVDVAANAQTTLAGTTAGTVTYSQSGGTPWDRRFVAYLDGYQNAGGTPQTITFVVPYANPPAIVKDDSGGVTATSTTLTLPASMTGPVTGYVIAEGGTGPAGASGAASSFGVPQLAGDLGGTSAAPEVTGTHLAAPLPVAQGGTGAASAFDALTALGGVASPVLGAVTMSPMGIANGQATIANNGAQYGPDTPGTTTQGLAEAFAAAIALVDGATTTTAPPRVLIGPGEIDLTVTAEVPVPSNVPTNGIAFEIEGAGHLSTRIRVSAGQGILFGQYAWQDVIIRNLAIESVDGGTQTSLITMVGSGTAFPGLRSEMMFDHVWFECPSAPGSLPADGCVYFGPYNGQTGGFDLYFANCSLVGSFSITSPFNATFVNSLVGSGSGVVFTTTCAVTTILACEVVGQIALPDANCAVRVSYSAWTEIPAATGAVAAAATTGTTKVTVGDSSLAFLGTGPVVAQAGSAVELHFHGNTVYVAGGTYTLLGGGCYLARTSTSNGNADGYLSGTGGIVQGTTLTANPPVSGTQYQNTHSIALDLHVPVTYNPTGTAAATCQLALGPTSAAAVSTESYPAGSTPGVTATLRFRVPAGWYYKLTATNAVIGTASVLPEQ